MDIAFESGRGARAVDVVKAVYGVDISPFAIRRTELVLRIDAP
jgi:hypothetical protein